MVWVGQASNHELTLACSGCCGGDNTTHKVLGGGCAALDGSGPASATGHSGKARTWLGTFGLCANANRGSKVTKSDSSEVTQAGVVCTAFTGTCTKGTRSCVSHRHH